MTAVLRHFDVRPAEARPVLAAFGSLLFIVVAHTLLETARDALFLAHLGTKALGYMYIAAAAITLAAGAASSRAGARFGPRRALLGAQLGSAAGAAAFFFVPPSAAALTGLYAFSVVSGALLVPQLWAAAAAMFHAGQGRRLFGVIAIAGVLGGVLGSSAGAAALVVADVRWLLFAAAGAYALSAGVLALGPRPRAAPGGRGAPAPRGGWWVALREEPALARLALVAALGAAATLSADYLFKASAAASVPPAELGPFFARYYAATNVLALAVQLLIAPRVLARAGVVGAAALLPSLLLVGGALGVLSGGALWAAVGARAVDGALRHSVQRTGVELVFLAAPAAARDRARPFIDGAITRLAQAATAGLLLLLAAGGGGGRALAAVTAVAAAAWLGATVALRGPYVALFRRALLGPAGAEPRSPVELDLASVELLVEALSSPRPREAIAAMRALGRRGRAGLVPGLVLLRDEVEVLECALDLLGGSSRADWVRFAEARLGDRRERVRRAAMRALARARRAGDGAAGGAAGGAGERPWVRGYLAVEAVARGAPAPGELPALLGPDEGGREARLGALRALADVAPSPRLGELLADLVAGAPAPLDREAVELVARAAANVRAAGLVPWLAERLARREGRPAVRAALAALGDGAFDHLAAALARRDGERLWRAQLPPALAEFGTQRAADVLFAYARRGDDGLVRHRCLLALERMAVAHAARPPAAAARAAARAELAEHFRLLALRCALGPAAADGPPGGALGLLLALLDEKRAQAFGRALGLVQLCFPDESLRPAQSALASGDAARRANAAEFLDELLAQPGRRRDDGLRAALRLAAEDLPDAERVARARALGHVDAPAAPDPAVAALCADADAGLAALAGAAREELAARPPRGARPAMRPAPAPAAPVGLPGAPLGAHGR